MRSTLERVALGAAEMAVLVRDLQVKDLPVPTPVEGRHGGPDGLRDPVSLVRK